MRIVGFHIEGFGCLSDVSLTDVPPGLSIVVGENEAGKTTLLAFLRSILFGFPSRKQNEYYPPLNGGRKGGRIVLLDKQSERTIVERFEGRAIGPLTVTFPNGSQGGEEEFRQLIGSATADLYRNVFAFSLSELQTMESLATEKVRDAIYSAGIGIGRRTITDVVQELRTQSGDLFAPGGSKPVMNQTLSKIEDLRRRIRDHENDLDEYERLREELDATEAGVGQIGTELAAVRRRFERIQILQQAWNDWITLGDCREQLKSLPPIESFPENGVQRIDELCTERRSFNDQNKEAMAEKTGDETRLSEIEVDQAIAARNRRCSPTRTGTGAL